MSSLPKVTIHILSYNHAPFLSAAIESALVQTYENIEIIIVDDGSTDNSLSIAESYAARHPDRIQVLTHPGHANLGISATVNLSFEKATGDYVMGLASDDALHPQKVEEQVAYLERHPEIDWVYGYALYVDEHDRRRPELGLFGLDITLTADPVEQLILGNVICGMTVLMRREAVMQIEPHDETLVYGDWDFWVRLAARHKMAFLPRVRARCRVHNYNTSMGIPNEIILRHALEVVRKLRHQSERLGGLLARPRTRALLDLQCAFFRYGVQEEEQARQHLAAAFMTDPMLKQDWGYFCRWLSHCQRILQLMPSPMPKTDFAPWVHALLPADVDPRFNRAVARHIAGWRFGPRGRVYYLAETHWRSRRRLLSSLFRDPRVWRERELFALHVEALVGSRVRRSLRRLLRLRAASR